MSNLDNAELIATMRALERVIEKQNGRIDALVGVVQELVDELYEDGPDDDDEDDDDEDDLDDEDDQGLVEEVARKVIEVTGQSVARRARGRRKR